ncbi:unnamed protein product (macronuclear) [Paramecium tetraurelia]|uniref:Cation-transporting P-type ATPase N-terminal domain-containing protein n=1 Tax=Paramecium tetraurelia TaxID=5888 RepID=A0E3K1_PARTE|nr:uncharacterized protein GSPATT00023041001 [Paramecium tetraurelia]CAK89868.1 unnamed protein product [Paramecium tetraurelia]|eukprot:XP_001457265.1 hypothetical protein (macronuclear) [Paramecium tetraurelia strain d4-2]
MSEVLQEEKNPSQSQDNSLEKQNYRIPKQTLVQIVSAAQERLLAEEIEELEKIKGMETIERGLKTNFERGLKGDDFRERELFYGSNQKPKSFSKTYYEIILQCFEDYMIRALLVASILSIIIGVLTADEDCRSLAWIEGFALFMAIFICCNVAAINDYQKEKQLQSFNEKTPNQQMVTVLRDGKQTVLDSSRILVGDIIQLQEGLQIPADGFVIQAEALKVDESAITGETQPIKKDTYENCKQKKDELWDEKNSLYKYDIPSPVLLSGATILQGEGKMVVAVVGEASCIGKISSLEEKEVQQTVLQAKLEAVSSSVGFYGVIFSGLIFIVLLFRFILQRIREDTFEKQHINELLNLIIASISVVIIAIPDSFPFAITICLAYSIKRMLNDNILVKKLAALEISGYIDIICTDKTGTLTQNKMTMVKIWNDETIDIDAYSNNLNLSTYLPTEMHELFIQSSIVNGNAEIRPQEIGSLTEVALILFAEKCGINYEKEREIHQTTLTIPFSSQRKRRTSIIGGKRLVVHGGSEIIVEGCNKFHSKSKGVIPIDTTLRKQIEDNLNLMGAQAIRTLAFAYKDLNGDEDLVSKNQRDVYDIEAQDLTLIAIVGIKDTLRFGIPQAIRSLQTAGIKVQMITGDNKITSRAIAEDSRILINKNKSLVLEGPEFIQRVGRLVCKWCQTPDCDCPSDPSSAKTLRKQMRVDTIQNQEEFDKIYPQLDVLARSRPEDKYTLVQGLQERGHVVAVAGDGTNDAPALSKADVGIALGISATEIAQKSASIILLDDNFSSIIKLIFWGRNIQDSIKKLIQFQLTAIIVIVATTLISSIFIKQEIFKPIQLLWINLIIDSFASLALATEAPSPNILRRKCEDKNAPIINSRMLKHILGQATYQIVIISILLFYAHTFVPEFKGEEDEQLYYTGKLQFKYSNTYFDQNSKLHTCPDYEDHCNLISQGTEYNVNGTENYLTFYKKTYISSRQFTFIFNTFVMMQLFNFFNARRIKDELNIFQGIFRNTVFLITFFGILVLQILIVTYGGIVFHCYSFNGLRIEQWLICIYFALGGLVVRSILILIPNSMLEIFTGNVSRKSRKLQPHYQVIEFKNLKNQTQEN